eukprot:CAMPEP_0179134594 /NCGR_PEP_ID=MMETSP0796-20121207/64053_1 /TAXON_ID=73915 /ORGANISM="Pyrodinium bahamense, Strain pbaha01" /LENGTH=551 /DNA_ID=CAMNT_0020833595 /DNA_START=65 /DNA_END=1720 /DNA_ORIENTATION=-
MAMPDTTPRPNTAKSITGLTNEAVGLQVQQFLDEWHYRLMNVLGKGWTQTKAVTAALDIMALNGISLTPEEIKEYAVMDEQQMVHELVPKLPTVMREDFDHLALQLQMLVTTASRVRKSIDEGVPEGVQETIEDVDSTSIGQQILKQAVVQASKEVAALHRCQDTWFRSMEKRLDRLTRSAELAEHAQQQLIAVESQLAKFGAEQNEKSKKALLGFAEGNDKSLVHTTFGSWLGLALANRGERELRKKFEQEIEDAERRLFEYKEKQLAGVKGVLMRNARDGDEALVQFCLQTWSDQVAEIKREGTTKEALMAMEAKLEKFQSANSDNTKKVMSRMGADQDARLLEIAWSAWLTFSQDYKKDKDFEDAVKRAEQQLQAHMQKKKEDAKVVLDRMNGATESGLLAMCIQGWYQSIIDNKKTRDLEEQIASQGNKFKSLQLRQKDNAMSVQGRVNEQIKANLLLRCVSVWMLEAKVNRTDKYYTNKMNHKRQQLQSVQTLFKSFAKQLEEGLGNIEGPGDSSGRTMTRRSKPGMVKDYGSASLPDIHARPMVA